MSKSLNKLKEKYLNELDKKLDDNIDTIYQKGKDSDFSKIDKKKNNWIKKVLIGQFIALIFLFTFLVIMLYLNKDKEEKDSSVEVNYELPKEISSGDEADFKIHYKNIENFTLYETEMVVKYPEGFEFLASDPASTNQYHDTWTLGDLVKGEEGEIVVKGKIIGELGGLVTFNTSMFYRPENFSSPFRKYFSSPTIQITKSILSIVVSGPSKIISDQDISYSIHYKNSSEKDLENIKIIATYPEGFEFFSSVPQATAVPALKDDEIENKDARINNIWIIQSLPRGKDGEIVVKGLFRDIENDKGDFSVEIGTVSQDNTYAVYQKNTLPLEIINPGLKVDLAVNESREDISVNFADTLNYSIVYKNLGKKTLYNLRVTANIDSDVLDWDTLIDASHGKKEKNIIIWDGESSPGLGILKPLDEGVIDFSIRLKDMRMVDLEKDDLKTTVNAEFIISKIEDLDTQVKISTKTLVSNINTDLDLKVQGRYYTDDNIPVGQGPLPPQVGEKTFFRIYWNLSNNLHEVSGVVVATNIASDAKWEDKFSSTVGKLVYNSEDRSVVWMIPKISPNKNFEDLEAWFDISIIPEKGYVGKLMVLTTETKLSAKDNVTSSGISHLGTTITTNLEDDPFGGGRGLVIGGGE